MDNNAIRVTDVADGQTEVRIYTRDNNEYKQVVQISPYGNVGIALDTDPQASLHVGNEARFDGGIRVSGRRVISWDNAAHTFYDVNRLVTVAPEAHFLFADKFEVRHGAQSRNTLKLRVQGDGTYIHESLVNRLSERDAKILCIQYVWNAGESGGRLMLNRGDVNALVAKYSLPSRIIPMYFTYKDDIYAIYPLYSDSKCVFWRYVAGREPWDRSLPWPGEFNIAWQRVVTPGWNAQTPIAARTGLLPEKIEFQVDEIMDDKNVFQVTDKFEEPLLSVCSSNYGMIGMFNSNPQFPLHVTNNRGWSDWMGCFQNDNTNIKLSHRLGHGLLIDRLTMDNPAVTVFECKNRQHTHLLVRGDGITAIGYSNDKIPYPNNVRFQVDGDTWTSGYALISNVKIGTIQTPHAHFGHCNMYQTNNYALKQQSDGITCLNAPTNRSVRLCINDVEYMRLDSDTGTEGNVGIRCVRPTAALQVTPRLGVNPESNGVYIYNSNQSEYDRFYHAILGMHTARDKPYVAWKCDYTGNAWSMGMDSEDQGKLKIQSAWTLDGNVPRFTMDTNGFTTFMNSESNDLSPTCAFKVQRSDSNNEHSVHMYVRNDGRVAVRHSSPLTTLDVKGKLLVDDRRSNGLPVVGDVGSGGDRVIIQKGTSTKFPISIGVDAGDVLWNSVPNAGSFKWYHNSSNQAQVMQLRCNQLELRAQVFANVDDIGKVPMATMDNPGARIILRRNEASQYPTAIGYNDCNLEWIPEGSSTVYQKNMMWFGVPTKGTFTWYNNNSNFMTLDSCNVLQVTHCNTDPNSIKGMIKCGRLQTYGYVSTSNNYIDTGRAFMRTSQMRFSQVLYDAPRTGIDSKDYFVGGEGTRISLHDTVTSDYQFAIGMDSNAMWNSMPLSNMGQRTFFKWYVGGVEELTLTNDDLNLKSNNIEMGHGRIKFSACNISEPATNGEVNNTAAMNSTNGTRIVYAMSSNLTTEYPYATGMEKEALWQSVPVGKNHRWYVGGARELNLDSNQLDTCSNNVEMGYGRVTFSGGNLSGPNKNAQLFDSNVKRVDGTRVIYRPSADTNTAFPWASGVDATNLWHSVPSGSSHAWYVGGSLDMTLDSNQINTCSNNIEMGYGKIKFSAGSVSEPKLTAQLDDSNLKLADGTCVVYRPSANTGTTFPWASGVGACNLWHSVPASNNHSWYINGVLEMNLDSNNLNLRSNNIEMGKGWVMWNGSDSNRPSAGTPGGGKVILQPRVGANYSTAIGDADAQMWFGVPYQHSFRYYVQGENILRIQRPDVSDVDANDDFGNIASGAVVFGTKNTSAESYIGNGTKVVLGSNMAMGMNSNYMWWYSGTQNYFTWNIGGQRILSLYNNATGANIQLPYLMSTTLKSSFASDPIVMTGHHLQANIISSTMTKNVYCESIFTKDTGYINTGAVHVGGYIDASDSSTAEGVAGVSLMKKDNKYTVFSRDLVVSHGDVIAKNQLYSSNNATVVNQLRVNNEILCSNLKGVGTNIVLHNTLVSKDNSQSINNMKEFTGSDLKVNNIYEYTSGNKIYLQNSTVFCNNLMNSTQEILLNPGTSTITTKTLKVPGTDEIRFEGGSGAKNNAYVPNLFSKNYVMSKNIILVDNDSKHSSTATTFDLPTITYTGTNEFGFNKKLNGPSALFSNLTIKTQIDMTDAALLMGTTGTVNFGASTSLKSDAFSNLPGTSMSSLTVTNASTLNGAVTMKIDSVCDGKFTAGTLKSNGAFETNGITSSAGITCTSGNIQANNGDVVAGSDARIKTDVRAIENALDKIVRLAGKTYLLKAAPEQGRKMGLIAQEVEDVVPEVVHRDVDGFYSLAYMNLVALLIEGIKELKQQLDTVLP